MILTQGPKSPKKWPQLRVATWFLMFFWFFSAVAGTIVNKRVIKQFPYPVAVTSFHLFIGSIFDYFIVRQKRGNNFSFDFSHLKVCLWNGVFFSMSKYLTYLSYKNVPVSLTHTIKASGPIFSVMTQLFWMQECVPMSEILTLIPITVGVTLSTVTELEFEMVGFVSAVIATLLGVLQNTTSKHVLTHIHSITPMELHLYGSLLSLIFLIPLGIFTEGTNILTQRLLYNNYYELLNIEKNVKMNELISQYPNIDFNNLMRNENMENSNLFEMKSNIIENMNEIEFPWFLMFMSCVWLYGQTMGSLYLLKRVTTVTHQVANTLKRLMIIVLSILYFQNEITIWNGFGIFLALFGFGIYQHIHKKNNRKRLAMKLSQKYENNVETSLSSHSSASSSVNVMIIEKNYQDSTRDIMDVDDATTAVANHSGARIDDHTVTTQSQSGNLVARDTHHTHRQNQVNR